MKIVAIGLNVLLVGMVLYALLIKGAGAEELFFIVVVFLTPLVNVYVLLTEGRTHATSAIDAEMARRKNAP